MKSLSRAPQKLDWKAEPGTNTGKPFQAGLIFVSIDKYELKCDVPLHTSIRTGGKCLSLRKHSSLVWRNANDEVKKFSDDCSRLNGDSANLEPLL